MVLFVPFVSFVEEDTWFSSCLSCPSWIKDMLCCPRETSPRSFHFPRSIPQVAHVRGGLLRCAPTNVRRPGVIHGVTPPGSVPARSEPLMPSGVSAHSKRASHAPRGLCHSKPSWHLSPLLLCHKTLSPLLLCLHINLFFLYEINLSVKKSVLSVL